MAEPVDSLVTLIESADNLPAGLNIYPYPVEQLVVPAIVIRPDTPWMEPDRFCFERERYVAIPVVSASTPGDGIAMLRLLSLAIIGALVSPWDWESVDGPVIDESTGTPFLANRIRLLFRNGGTA